MNYSKNCLLVTKHFEGCVLHAYADPATGGKPYTAGYGHTGSDVKLGMVVTQEIADKWLADDLAKAASLVSKYAPHITDQGVFDCLVDMTFNMGSAFIQNDTIVGDFDDLVRSGDWSKIKPKVSQFRMAAGKVLPGLVKRRIADVALGDGKSGEEAIRLASS